MYDSEKMFKEQYEKLEKIRFAALFLLRKRHRIFNQWAANDSAWLELEKLIGQEAQTREAQDGQVLR